MLQVQVVLNPVETLAIGDLVLVQQNLATPSAPVAESGGHCGYRARAG
jgi:hypothetical protein